MSSENFRKIDIAVTSQYSMDFFHYNSSRRLYILADITLSKKHFALAITQAAK